MGTIVKVLLTSKRERVIYVRGKEKRLASKKVHLMGILKYWSKRHSNMIAKFQLFLCEAFMNESNDSM